MALEVPDRVVVEEGGQEREIAIAVFLALSLTERVRYLLADRVRFFSGQRRLPTAAALRALMGVAHKPVGSS